MKTCLLYIAAIGLILSANSCNTARENKYNVSKLLIEVSHENDVDYCSLLENAYAGDIDAIKQLSLMEFHEACGYEHGIILKNLIKEIGEDAYILAIKETTEKQRQMILGYLDVGIQYDSPEDITITQNDVEEVFPKLFLFLTNREHEII